ncbi:MAG TPA: 2-hydroxychromene-2-carboxylate isomerase [Xanthobacteraceae bacterium]|nr:2-hydroxychromene-2-carboxylate isomerase [Xanthobacteraceae bacterium]
MSQPIDFYFDFISPYAYIGSTQIEALAARHGRTVNWRPVLIGITVMKIMGIKPLIETPLKSDYLRHDGARMAKIYDVPFKYHGLSGINSLAACRAFLWLKPQDEQLALRFARRIFERLWVDGLDITAREDIAAEAAALGVNGHDLLVAITSREGKQALNVAVDEAVARGVFGVPYFIADGEPIWGGDRLWMLDYWLTHGTWEGAGRAVLENG